MNFDLARFDIDGWDSVLITTEAGLKLMKCLSWPEGSSHGGGISGYEVDVLFGDITEAENPVGHTDYRKCFILASENDVLNKQYTPVLVDAPAEIASRMTITIASGTNSDTFATKPADNLFSSSLTCDIVSGQYKPIWLKRTIAATESDIVYYRNVTVSILVGDPV